MAELQEAIGDLPRFCLFYIAFGLEVIALILSGIADVSPYDKERVKKVKVYFLLAYYSAECLVIQLAYCLGSTLTCRTQRQERPF